MQDWKTLSEIFYNFALGLAAISGGIFIGIKSIAQLISGWRKNDR